LEVAGHRSANRRVALVLLESQLFERRLPPSGLVAPTRRCTRAAHARGDSHRRWPSPTTAFPLRGGCACWPTPETPETFFATAAKGRSALAFSLGEQTSPAPRKGAGNFSLTPEASGVAPRRS